MEITWIEFLKDWKEYEPGDVATVSFQSPKIHRLIDEGIAKRYIPEKPMKNER